MKPELSIIVPVYNTSKYLQKCLDSIINQTLKKIEIIIINDGSTDNSEEIVLNYLRKDTRIQYYKQENKGVSSARNKGIELSKSEYIIFVDSDDFIDLNLVEDTLEKIKQEELDIVFFGIKSVDQNGKIKNYIEINKNNLISDVFFRSYPVNKIYRKKLFIENNIKFPLGKKYEDIYTIPRVILSTKKIGYIDRYYYNYYIGRPTSITSERNNFQTILDLIEAKKFINNFLQEKNLQTLYRESINQVKKDILVSMKYNSFEFCIKSYPKIIEELKKLEVWEKKDYIKVIYSIIIPWYFFKKSLNIIRVRGVK